MTEDGTELGVQPIDAMIDKMPHELDGIHIFVSDNVRHHCD